MRRAAWTVVVLFTAGAATAAAPEPPMLMIPLVREGETHSESMQALLATFKADRTLTQLDAWERLDALPEWVFDQKQREIAYLPPRPLLVHDYRYAVIAGRHGELLVVRAGGYADRYEIFRRKPHDLGGPSASSAPADEKSAAVPTPPPENQPSERP